MFIHSQERMYLAGVFLGALLIFDLSPIVDHVSDGDQSAVDLAPDAQLRSVFGYEIGEERRYVLEPTRSLRAGDSAWWSIVLDDIQGTGDDISIIFDLHDTNNGPETFIALRLSETFLGVSTVVCRW